MRRHDLTGLLPNEHIFYSFKWKLDEHFKMLFDHKSFFVINLKKIKIKIKKSE